MICSTSEVGVPTQADKHTNTNTTSKFTVTYTELNTAKKVQCPRCCLHESCQRSLHVGHSPHLAHSISSMKPSPSSSSFHSEHHIASVTTAISSSTDVQRTAHLHLGHVVASSSEFFNSRDRQRRSSSHLSLQSVQCIILSGVTHP